MRSEQAQIGARVRVATLGCTLSGRDLRARSVESGAISSIWPSTYCLTTGACSCSGISSLEDLLQLVMPEQLHAPVVEQHIEGQVLGATPLSTFH